MGRVEGLAPTLDVWLEAGGGQKLEEVVGRGRRLEAAGCWMLEDEGDRGRDEDGERRLDDGGGWRRLDVGIDVFQVCLNTSREGTIHNGDTRQNQEYPA